MKNHHKIKLIAASVALMASFGASAGLGGLNVQSHLGEPFSGTITVTGEEAKALLNGGKASISNGSLRAGVRKSGDNAVVSIRSSKPIQDPVLIFQVGVGSQSREYTAIIDPAGYTNKTDGSTRVHANSQINRIEAAPAERTIDRQAAKERIGRAMAGEDTAAAVRKERTRKTADNKKSVKAEKAKQAENAIVYGKRHLVRQGETLNSIAARIRPQGMTLAQTVQALVSANPDVFVGNDANRMLAGKVLNIPSRSELRGHIGADTSASKPSETTAVDTTPDVPAATPADTAASAEAKNPAETNTVAAPEQTAPQETSASTAASAPVETVASAAASDIAASAQASAAEPVQPAVEPAQQETAAESEDSGLLRWLLLGGAGLIALYLLSKLFGKRKSAEQAEVAESAVAAEKVEDEEDFTEFKTIPEAEQSFTSDALKTTAVVAGAGAAAAAVAHVAKKDDELEVEDDFGDDVFFTEVEEAPAAKQGDVDFDLNAIGNSQEAIVSGAVTHDEETEKRRHADWDAIESTESVYEPEPENPYGADTAAKETEAQSVEAFAAAPQADSKDSWDFSLEEAETEKVEAVAEKAEEWDFFAEEPKAEAAPVEVPTASAETETEKNEEWDFFAEESKAEEAQQAADEAIEFVAEEPKVEEESGSSVAATATAAVVTAATVAASKAFDFESAKAEETEAPLEFTAPEVEAVPEVVEAEVETVADVSEVAETAVETEISAEPELFKIQQAESLAFQDSEDLNAQVTQVAEADETIEWDNIAVADTADSSRRESGFISESVGMTAPLEAKYELAKMYVEIGDPDAARETLQELLEEADGAILSKAKAMLKDLDA